MVYHLALETESYVSGHAVVVAKFFRVSVSEHGVVEYGANEENYL